MFLVPCSMNRMNQYLQAKKGEFDKVVEFFKKEISALRTGRASTAMLDNVLVEAYGIKNQLVSIASVSTSDSKSMTVAPWDKSVIKDIEKALQEADLGLGIVNEGDKIRLTVPLMTEENRKNLVKKLNEMMEGSRVSVRQVREAVKKSIEAAEEEGAIGEDEAERFSEELEAEVKKLNEELKAVRDKKEQEIMTI
jgi:ribosome recycling factor